MYAFEESTVEIPCKTNMKHSQVSILTWRRNDKFKIISCEFNTKECDTFNNNRLSTNRTNFMLIMRNVSVKDSDEYRCYTENNFGHLYIGVSKLNVLKRPEPEVKYITETKDCSNISIIAICSICLMCVAVVLTAIVTYKCTLRRFSFYS